MAIAPGGLFAFTGCEGILGGRMVVATSYGSWGKAGMLAGGWVPMEQKAFIASDFPGGRLGVRALEMGYTRLRAMDDGA